MQRLTKLSQHHMCLHLTLARETPPNLQHDLNSSHYHIPLNHLHTPVQTDYQESLGDSK